ncbi:glycosyl hydrolase family 61-domain-containing protein [Irpex rosettiformis]|uniref:Glycosyl hydrolase family 61-domain-containing protein n=1 Tax=Irpex rosettiformis TaxID=378272 RepID=A0ACB8TRG5_9APHY|nr:glycosyl hydrolase family 61-domain-containing protein [Irpex rosettiformis]
MKSFTTIAVSALALLPYVSAHGFVNKLVVDGKSYTGNVPAQKTNPSVIRQINSIDPVKGANNQDINCGHSAQKASLVADVQPGSTLEFFWLAGGGQLWPHNTGPVITYMGSCGNTAANECDAGNVKWFKIDEVGRGSDGQWVQASLMSGKSISATVPKNLAPGNYLIRHEIIALHLAETVGGAEFYPSCAQVKVGGNGNGTPKSSDLVTFPGGYSDTDPGIFDRSAFDASAKYIFPGPSLVSLSAGNSASSGSGSSNSSGAAAGAVASSPSSASSAQASAPSATTTKTCKLGQKRMVKRHSFFQRSH